MSWKVVLKGILLFLIIMAALTALYLSPLSPILKKRFWEYFSEIFLVSAVFAAWWRYSGGGSKFFLWCVIWLAALYFRDLHPFVWRNSRISGLPYYALIAGAVASGWPWRREIAEKLWQAPKIQIAWAAVVLLFGASYFWDHGLLRHTLPVDPALMRPFENYLEESSETAGCVLLFISVLL